MASSCTPSHHCESDCHGHLHCFYKREHARSAGTRRISKQGRRDLARSSRESSRRLRTSASPRRRCARGCRDRGVPVDRRRACMVRQSGISRGCAASVPRRAVSRRSCGRRVAHIRSDRLARSTRSTGHGALAITSAGVDNATGSLHVLDRADALASALTPACVSSMSAVALRFVIVASVFKSRLGPSSPKLCLFSSFSFRAVPTTLAFVRLNASHTDALCR